MIIVVFLLLILIGFMVVQQGKKDSGKDVHREGGLWQRVVARVRVVPERYPLASVAALTLCLIGWHIVYADAVHDIEYYTRTIMMLIALFFVSISSEMFAHSHGWNRRHRLWMHAGVVVFAGLYRALLPEEFDRLPYDFFIAHAMWYVCFVALLFVAMHIGRQKANNHDVYGHWATVTFAIALGFIFAIVTFALGALFLWSLDLLFDLDVNDGFAYWWVFAAAIVGPVMGLSHLPKHATHTRTEKLSKVFRALVSYILMPFVTLYFIVLYAYTGKIIFLWEWPEGTLSWMIIIFSIIGWLVYVMISPWFKSEKLFGFFVKWFPWIALPQIAMLFLALWWRVDAYGITINRYLVALFGVWLLINAVYYGFFHKKKLLVLAGTLIGLIFFTSFGPWGIFDISKQSQTHRLQEFVVEYNLVDGVGRIQKEDNNALTQDVQNDIYSVILYLKNTHGNVALENAIPVAYGEVRDSGTCREECNVDDIANALGIFYEYNRYSDKENGVQHIEYYYESDVMMRGFSVDKSSYVIPDLNLFQLEEHTYIFEVDNIEYAVKSVENQIIITSQKESNVIIAIDLYTLAEKARNYQNNEKFVEEFTVGNHTARLIIYNLSGTLKKGKYEVDYLNGVLLFR